MTSSLPAHAEAVASVARSSGVDSDPRLGNALSRLFSGDIGLVGDLHQEAVAWQDKRVRRLPGVAAALAFALGAVALAAAIWGTDGLLRLLLAGRPMHPLTAAGVMLCSLTVVLLMMERPWLTKVVALLSGVVGIALLVSGLLPSTVGNVTLAWGEPVAIAVGPAFVLFAISALAITDNRSGLRLIAAISGTAGLAITLLPFLGHMLLSGQPRERDAPLFMPLDTALSLAAVFGALLLVRPSASWIGLLLARDSRARIARILLLCALIPLPLGWLAERGHRAGLYGTDARLLLIVLGAVLLLSMLALAAAVMIGDEQRTRIEVERHVRDALLDRDARLLQLQAELIEVSRLSSMGEMAAALAHELNQPLTAAANFLGAAEMVLSQGRDTPKSRKHVADAVWRAKEEALRAGEIVRRLREFIARGEADMRRESLPDIINNAVLLGLASMEHKSIELEFSLSPEAECVLADRVQIQQVIVNIVRNAADAMAQQPAGSRRITIVTRATPQKNAEIVIADTGPGISDEVAATLFTPFMSSKATGMGVGLSICKRIVETHGGEIWAGQGRGGGAEFHFTLPLFNRAEDSA